jgi:hypothetical protein
MRIILGLPEGADLAQFFLDLGRRLGLPTDLRSIGVPWEAIPALADAAAKDFSARTNPRPAAAADYRLLLEEAYG